MKGLHCIYFWTITRLVLVSLCIVKDLNEPGSFLLHHSHEILTERRNNTVNFCQNRQCLCAAALLILLLEASNDHFMVITLRLFVARLLTSNASLCINLFTLSLLSPPSLVPMCSRLSRWPFQQMFIAWYPAWLSSNWSICIEQIAECVFCERLAWHKKAPANVCINESIFA